MRAGHLTTAVLVLGSLTLPLAAAAASFAVQVSDGSGAALRDAVVYLLPSAGTPAPAAAPRAVVAQQDRDFIPFVSAVRTGTAITFPNRDQLMHHVYSFSSAKNFQIKLYEGDPPHPIVFDKAGVVALGCNIHDWMRAYVMVVDTPYFAVTDARGHARIHGLPAGTYEARAWHPHASTEWRATHELRAADPPPVAVALATHAPPARVKPPLDPSKY